MHIYKWYNFLILSSIHKQIVLMSLLLQMITINIGCRYLFKLVFLFILDIFPEVEMLDHDCSVFHFYEDSPYCFP